MGNVSKKHVFQSEKKTLNARCIHEMYCERWFKEDAKNGHLYPGGTRVKRIDNVYNIHERRGIGLLLYVSDEVCRTPNAPKTCDG